MNFLPKFHRGTVDEHLPNGRAPFWESSMYVYDAETGGGISGGPLFEMKDRRVCGINSTGMDNAPYSVAADLRCALDWPIPFAEGQTLRDLAARGLVDLLSSPRIPASSLDPSPQATPKQAALGE